MHHTPLASLLAFAALAGLTVSLAIVLALGA